LRGVFFRFIPPIERERLSTGIEKIIEAAVTAMWEVIWNEDFAGEGGSLQEETRMTEVNVNGEVGITMRTTRI